jgi:hypothetical protein
MMKKLVNILKSEGFWVNFLLYFLYSMLVIVILKTLALM